MDFYNLHNLILEQISDVDEYYRSLNDYLSDYGLSLGENVWNKTGSVNKDQKGIFLDDRQIGKIERLIDSEDGVLILEHISAKYKGQRLVEKIYPHDKQFAESRALQVISDLVNPYTLDMFKKTFEDWQISEVRGPRQQMLLKAKL